MTTKTVRAPRIPTNATITRDEPTVRVWEEPAGACGHTGWPLKRTIRAEKRICYFVRLDDRSIVLEHLAASATPEMAALYAQNLNEDGDGSRHVMRIAPLWIKIDDTTDFVNPEHAEVYAEELATGMYDPCVNPWCAAA